MTFYEEHTGPMTLHSIMQGSVGIGLRSRYKPQQEIPHGLLVLLMQMNHDKRRAEQAERHHSTQAASSAK
jgi:hypothetical protein